MSFSLPFLNGFFVLPGLHRKIVPKFSVLWINPGFPV